MLLADGDTYSFRHALVQEAVYGDLLPGERARLHARFAAVLSAIRETRVQSGRGGFDQQISATAAELAHHRLAAHDLPGALQALLAAADEAEELAAPAEALGHLETAIDLFQRLDTGADQLDLLMRAAEAAAAAGEPGRAVAFGTASVAEADRRAVVEDRALTRERLAVYLMEDDRSPMDVSAEAVELLRGRPETPLLARVLAVRARALLWTDAEQAGDVLAEAGAVADRTGARVIAADAMVTRAIMVRRGIVPGDAGALLSGAIDRADRSVEGGTRILIRALRFRSNQLVEDGDLVGALAVTDEGVSLADDAGLTWSGYGLDLRLMRGWILIALGRWDEALAAGLQAVYAPTPQGRVLAAQAFAVLAGRDDPDAEQLLGRLRGSRDFYVELQLDIAESAWRLERGEPELAVELATRGIRMLDPHGWMTESDLLSTRAVAGHADLAALARAEGAADRAADHAGHARAIADRAVREPAETKRTDEYAALLLAQLKAETERAAGRDSPADWAAIAVAAEAIGRIPERMYAHWRELRARLTLGDRGALTVAAARAVVADAERVGAAGMLRAVHDLLHRVRLELGAVENGAAGVALRTGPADARLTSREAQVLELVAAGRSNRQIGKALFISDKTASVHVSHIMDKLGASSRTEAAALAREQGLLGPVDRPPGSKV